MEKRQEEALEMVFDRLDKTLDNINRQTNLRTENEQLFTNRNIDNIANENIQNNNRHHNRQQENRNRRTNSITTEERETTVVEPPLPFYKQLTSMSINEEPQIVQISPLNRNNNYNNNNRQRYNSRNSNRNDRFRQRSSSNNRNYSNSNNRDDRRNSSQREQNQRKYSAERRNEGNKYNNNNNKNRINNIKSDKNNDDPPGIDEYEYTSESSDEDQEILDKFYNANEDTCNTLINTLESNPTWILPMYQCNKCEQDFTKQKPILEIDFLLDSGATLNLLNEDTWNEIKYNNPEIH